jgi:hypothetical protein
VSALALCESVLRGQVHVDVQLTAVPSNLRRDSNNFISSLYFFLFLNTIDWVVGTVQGGREWVLSTARALGLLPLITVCFVRVGRGAERAAAAERVRAQVYVRVVCVGAPARRAGKGKAGLGRWRRLGRARRWWCVRVGARALRLWPWEWGVKDRAAMIKTYTGTSHEED